jgi:hypothetical protein
MGLFKNFETARGTSAICDEQRDGKVVPPLEGEKGAYVPNRCLDNCDRG